MGTLLESNPETRLFDLAAEGEGVGEARSRFHREVLGLGPGPEFEGGPLSSDPGAVQRRSTLNNDGTALQICTSHGARGRHVRIIVDPAADADPGAERFDRALEAVHRTANTCRDPGLALALLQRLPRILPPRDTAIHGLQGRALWHATDFGRRGLGVYTTARHGVPETRWTRTRGWLEELGAQEVTKAWDPLARTSRLASLGLEGSSADNLRAKVYMRSGRSVSLGELPDPRFRHPAMVSFLTHGLEGLEVPPSALLISFSVFTEGARRGRPADIKLDLCAHCARRSPSDWKARIDSLGADLGFETGDSVLDPDIAELAFLGLGIDSDGQPRLNSYWKPRS